MLRIHPTSLDGDYWPLRRKRRGRKRRRASRSIVSVCGVETRYVECAYFGRRGARIYAPLHLPIAAPGIEVYCNKPNCSRWSMLVYSDRPDLRTSIVANVSSEDAAISTLHSSKCQPTPLLSTDRQRDFRPRRAFTNKLTLDHQVSLSRTINTTHRLVTPSRRSPPFHRVSVPTIHIDHGLLPEFRVEGGETEE